LRPAAISRGVLPSTNSQPPHDLGFGLVDLELAWFACDRPIAVGAAPGVATVADHALEAAAGVDDQVLEKHLAHERA
jgi:hypothetical protein